MYIKRASSISSMVPGRLKGKTNCGLSLKKQSLIEETAGRWGRGGGGSIILNIEN